MLLPPPNDTEKAQDLAAQVGCSVFYFLTPDASLRPALLGSVASFAPSLHEFGAHWDKIDMVHVFRNWPTLEAALRHVIDARSKAR